jgi:hypothetical protein
LRVRLTLSVQFSETDIVLVLESVARKRIVEAEVIETLACVCVSVICRIVTRL